MLWFITLGIRWQGKTDLRFEEIVARTVRPFRGKIWSIIGLHVGLTSTSNCILCVVCEIITEERSQNLSWSFSHFHSFSIVVCNLIKVVRELRNWDLGGLKIGPIHLGRFGGVSKCFRYGLGWVGSKWVCGRILGKWFDWLISTVGS